MTDTQAIRQDIIDWLDDQIHFGEAASLIRSDEMSFLENGILDSLGFVRLVVHLEERYHLTIDRKVLTRENFDSLGLIVRFISTQVGGAAT
jgi:acyl carrier protein